MFELSYPNMLFAALDIAFVHFAAIVGETVAKLVPSHPNTEITPAIVLVYTTYYSLQPFIITYL